LGDLDASPRMALLHECWLGANLAEDIASALVLVRHDVVDARSARDISQLFERLRESSRALKDLYDLAPVYQERLPNVLAYLPIFVPCFRRTLVDIREYLSQAGRLSFQRIWIQIHDHLVEEARMSVDERFRIYNGYIKQLVRKLTRSWLPPYDWWIQPF
jgi:hypothetical protein